MCVYENRQIIILTETNVISRHIKKKKKWRKLQHREPRAGDYCSELLKKRRRTPHTGKRNRCKDVPELFLVIPRKKKLKDVEKPGVEENCVFEGHYRYQKFV